MNYDTILLVDVAIICDGKEYEMEIWIEDGENDKEHLIILSQTLTEWDSPEDEEAYRDLQDCL